MQEINHCIYILFVVSDDHRIEIGAYDQNDILNTPNFEALMNRGFTFTHAYTEQAICAITRPDTTRIWNIGGSHYDCYIGSDESYSWSQSFWDC